MIKKQEEPTDWVNSMVIVETPKKLRICLDPRDLNKAIKREHFPMKTIEEVVQNMPGAKVFSKLDATSGYWQLKLDEESSKLCTFNTPFGRYRFLRVPFGIVSASEIFQRVMSQMVEDIDGSEAIMDDIVVWGKDQAEHDMRLKQVMDKAKGMWSEVQQKQVQVSTEPDFLCRTCIVWGRSESRSREDQSSSRHEATTEPERTDDISRIHTISEEIHAQHGRHQCSSQKTDREGC